MNLSDAYQQLKIGKKVKLPEWSGYWFISETTSALTPFTETIRVFTKDGDVLDTPWIEKYKDRDDWEITEGRLDFGFALRALKSGKRVCRAGWNGKGMYLMLFEGQKDIAKAFGCGYGEMRGEFSFVDVIAIKSAQNTMVLGWHPSTPDMLSEDWQLVDEHV